MEKKSKQNFLLLFIVFSIAVFSLLVGGILIKTTLKLWQQEKIPTSTPTPISSRTPTTIPSQTPTNTLVATEIMVSTETSQPPTATPEPPIPVEKLGTIEKDIIYCVHDGVELKLDIYYPENFAETAWPVAIYFHGGGWASGSKDYSGNLTEVMREAGFLTVSVDYRLAPDYIFPAFMEDAKCAVRFLRANAETFNADPDKFGAYGDSAGGHIAAMLGVTGDSNYFQTDQWAGVSDAVQVVVDFYGPTRMQGLCADHSEGYFMVMQAFNPNSCYDEALDLANPMTFASPGDAPTMLLHGTSDYLIDYEHSVLLHEALKAANVPTSLGTMEGAGHSIYESENLSPDYIMLMLIDYMEKWLPE